MNRDRIRIESVEYDEAIVVVRRILQLETRITQDYFARTNRALLQVSKILGVLRNAANCRIDLVESPLLIRTRVSRHRSGSESDNSDVR